MTAGTWLLGHCDDGSPVYHQERPGTSAPLRSDHVAACLSEGICPDHLVPFTEYGQLFDFRPHRFRCAECGPAVAWVTAHPTFRGSQRITFTEGNKLAWKRA